MFGTDPPYGRTMNGLYLLLRTLRCAGVGHQTTAEILSGSVERMLAGEPLVAAAAPPAPRDLVIDARLLRFHTYCMMTLGAMISGNRERAVGFVRLARGVCREPDPGAFEQLFAELGTALDATVDAMATATDDPTAARRALGPLFMAMATAATEQPQRA